MSKNSHETLVYCWLARTWFMAKQQVLLQLDQVTNYCKNHKIGTPKTIAIILKKIKHCGLTIQ